MNQLETIESGKLANLILVKDNPLKDLSIIRKLGTMSIKGRRLDRLALDKFENRAKDRANGSATVIRYLENSLFEK